MGWVVVGGQSRNVGKTSAVCSLIAAFPECRWTAVKITQFGHGICSRSGHACDCACDDADWALQEQRNRTGPKDTPRFLRAGASRVWWLRCRRGKLAAAMPSLDAALAGDPWVICESNSLVSLRRPDLYLMLLDAGVADWKDSARSLLSRADARLLVDRASIPNGTDMPVRPLAPQPPAAAGSGQRAAIPPLASAAETPLFPVAPPSFLSAAVVAWVRARLALG
ncbi:MAG: hypothetical protein ACRD2F_10205 [Terriglobales bacterium]